MNFTAGKVDLDGKEALGAAGGATIDVASDGKGEGASFNGVLGPDQALWLRPG